MNGVSTPDQVAHLGHRASPGRRSPWRGPAPGPAAWRCGARRCRRPSRCGSRCRRRTSRRGRVPTASASTIIRRMTARVPGSSAMRASVPVVRALTGLKERLPHSFTQMSSRMRGPHRRLEAGPRQRVREPRRPRRLAAVRLAQHEAVAVVVLDHAGRDHLGRRIDDAAEAALARDQRARASRRDRRCGCGSPSCGPASL